MRSSNHLIGLLNFFTFLLSIPILGGGIWLSTRANNTDCLKFLQWPLIIIGVAIMVVSLAGFAGACYRNTFLMWLYLFAMFFIIAALLGFIIFAYVVTDKGSGRPVANRAYDDYYLQDYSGWLAQRVQDASYWAKISSCIRDSKICSKLGRTVGGVPETGDMFVRRKLNPIEVCSLSFPLIFFIRFYKIQSVTLKNMNHEKVNRLCIETLLVLFLFNASSFHQKNKISSKWILFYFLMFNISSGLIFNLFFFLI